jgi:hypothetical protein
VDRLLLTAAAPRLVAVIGTGARPSGGPTMLTVLQRAGALVIRGEKGASGTKGRLVRLSSGGGAARPLPLPGRGSVGQAGA